MRLFQEIITGNILENARVIDASRDNDPNKREENSW